MYSEVNNGFDWYKNKAMNVRQRGNIALIATATIRNGELVNMPASKQRYVWPTSLEARDSRVLSRRIWGREA